MRAIDLFLRLFKLAVPVLSRARSIVVTTSRVLWDAAFAFFSEEALIRASSLAFTTLVSIVPMLAVGLHIMNFYGISSGTRSELEDVLAQYFLPSQSRDIVALVASAAKDITRNVGAIGLLGFCVTLVLMARELEGHVLKICNTKSTWRMSALHYAAFVLLAPTGIILAYVVLHPLVSFLRFLPAEMSYVNYPFILAEFVVIILLRALSCYSLSWRACTFGAIAAGLAASASWKVCALYFAASASMSAYGALAFIPAFLLWVFIAWCCMLFGVQVAAKAQAVLPPCTHRPW